MKTNLCKYIISFVLIFSVSLFNYLYERFQIEREDLLLNPNFSKGKTNWVVFGPESSITLDASGGIILFSDDPQQNIRLSQNVFNIEGGSLLEFTGEIKTIDVIPKDHNVSWQRARLHMSNFNNQGKWLSGANVIVALKGDTSWKKYSKILKVNPEAVQVRLSAQLLHCTGTFMIKSLSLHRAIEKPIYPYLKATFLILLTLCFFWLFVPYIFNSRRKILKILVMLVLIMILIGVLFPKKVFFKNVIAESDVYNQELKAQPLSQVKKMTPVEHRIRKFLNLLPLPKVGHFILFLFLSFCMTAIAIKKYKKNLIMDIICFAGITELMQVFIEGRTPLLMDFFLDIAGGGLGILVFFVLQPTRKK